MAVTPHIKSVQGDKEKRTMNAVISAIEYYLPERVLSTAQLAGEFPEWSIEKIELKTGIRERRVAGENECASDLAFFACRKLFDSGACRPEQIDYILLCTQSPDYFLPTTACLLQERLGIPTTAGALDFNLGCSGYIYGLGLANGLIQTRQAANILLITAETYSKFIHPKDRSVRTIFGDAAAVTLLQSIEGDFPSLGPFVYGTDGMGAKNLIVKTGGMRSARTVETGVAIQDDGGNWRSPGFCTWHWGQRNPPETDFTGELEALERNVDTQVRETDLPQSAPAPRRHLPNSSPESTLLPCLLVPSGATAIVNSAPQKLRTSFDWLVRVSALGLAWPPIRTRCCVIHGSHEPHSSKQDRQWSGVVRTCRDGKPVLLKEGHLVNDLTVSDKGGLYVQYGCGFSAPSSSLNFDASPTL